MLTKDEKIQRAKDRKQAHAELMAEITPKSNTTSRTKREKDCINRLKSKTNLRNYTAEMRKIALKVISRGAFFGFSVAESYEVLYKIIAIPPIEGLKKVYASDALAAKITRAKQDLSDLLRLRASEHDIKAKRDEVSKLERERTNSFDKVSMAKSNLSLAQVAYQKARVSGVGIAEASEAHTDAMRELNWALRREKRRTKVLIRTKSVIHLLDTLAATPKSTLTPTQGFIDRTQEEKAQREPIPMRAETIHELEIRMQADLDAKLAVWRAEADQTLAEFDIAETKRGADELGDRIIESREKWKRVKASHKSAADKAAWRPQEQVRLERWADKRDAVTAAKRVALKARLDKQVEAKRQKEDVKAGKQTAYFYIRRGK